MKQKTSFWEIVLKGLVFFLDTLGKIVAVVLDIVGHLLNVLGLLLAAFFAPRETGDIVQASRQRKHRREIDELRAEVDALKKKEQKSS